MVVEGGTDVICPSTPWRIIRKWFAKVPVLCSHSQRRWWAVFNWQGCSGVLSHELLVSGMGYGMRNLKAFCKLSYQGCSICYPAQHKDRTVNLSWPQLISIYGTVQ